MTLAAIAAVAGGGATLAGAATTSKSSSSGSQRGQHNELTGDAADKVKAAALGKVPGGTVLRVEDRGPDGAAYHAHVRRSNGTEVVVLVNSSFEATAVETRSARRGERRDHGPCRPGGDGREAARTGDTAPTVEATSVT